MTKYPRRIGYLVIGYFPWVFGHWSLGIFLPSNRTAPSKGSAMPFAAALSLASQTTEAIDEVCPTLAAALCGNPRPGAGVLFAAPSAVGLDPGGGRCKTHWRRGACWAWWAKAIVGNAARGGAAAGPERVGAPLGEEGAGRPFHLVLERTSEGASLLGWPDALVEAAPKETVVLLLGDPFTFPTDLFLQQINEDAPGLRVLGGMASGIRGRGGVPVPLRRRPASTRGRWGWCCKGPWGCARSCRRAAGRSAGRW